MKIGLLTYHAALNFGANLQALSTYNFLLHAGHSPIIINWFPYELEEEYNRSCPSIQADAHIAYRNTYFNLTKRCCTDKEVAEIIEMEKIEAIIIGSDAVLQHHPKLSRLVFPSRKIISFDSVTCDRMFPNPFWCSFMSYIKRELPIAYMSVSSQNSPYTLFSNKEFHSMKRSIECVGFCTTRDDWTAKMISKISDNRLSPTITPDPVFAFNQNVKSQLTQEEVMKKYNLPKQYFLFSFHNSKTVSYHWLEEFQKIANRHEFECVAFPFPNGVNFAHPFHKAIKLPLSPLDWYSLIKYSSGYIGHNMHPIVVSLHNAVPCYSFDNYGIVKFRIFVNKKSSKIYHIMKKFGVLDNHVNTSGLWWKRPTPSDVFDKICNFDKEGVAMHSKDYLESYNIMMDNILNYFQVKAKTHI